jgi:hypothetical protein
VGWGGFPLFTCVKLMNAILLASKRKIPCFQVKVKTRSTLNLFAGNVIMDLGKKHGWFFFFFFFVINYLCAVGIKWIYYLVVA